MKSRLESYFESLVAEHLLNFVPEFKFHPTRKWRFDFADVDNKIAVELEGGIWINGRHNRGKGYESDIEKYNEALILGWRVLRYTSSFAIRRRFLSDYNTLLNIK